MCASLGPTSLGLSELPGLPGSLSFARLGKFPFIMFSNKFSISFSPYSPSGTPVIWMLEHLKLSWRFLSPSSFFLNSCFSILFWLNVYFFLLLQTIDLSPSFLPITVGSLCIFLYFNFHSFHFFLDFATILNQFCEHPDYQCFELCI